jgi:hypothetical protein
LADDGTEAILERLDALIALTQIAHADSISRQRDALRTDPLAAAILDHTEAWIAGGDLTRAVVTETGGGASTIGKRLSELVARGILRRSGAGHATRYKNSGIL